MLEEKLGKEIRVIPAFSYGFERGGTERTGKRMKGKCIYVHPKGRFVVLEFTFKAGRLREAFTMEEMP